MTNKQLIEELKNADTERIECYLRMLDRVFIYSIAANMLPQESIDSILSLWNTIVKKGIDLDVQLRTELMESKKGRVAKLNKEPDGEELRLHLLKQLRIAKDAASANLQASRGKEDQDFQETVE